MLQCVFSLSEGESRWEGHQPSSALFVTFPFYLIDLDFTSLDLDGAVPEFVKNHERTLCLVTKALSPDATSAFLSAATSVVIRRLMESNN